MNPQSTSMPGFQGSDHSHVEVTIYPKGGDPVLLSSQPSVKMKLDGQQGTDNAPSATYVSTQKSIASASGSFLINLKPSMASEILFNQVSDDDWVDIVFYKGNDGYHVMRGLIDSIGRTRSASGKGVTTRQFTISGRDFGKVWEVTPVWFCPYANDLVTESASINIFNGVPFNFQSPGKAPLYYLEQFMEAFTASGGVNWLPPRGMPGMIYDKFTENIDFRKNTDGGSRSFQNVPPRRIFNAVSMNPQGMCWDLARTYSDPAFTELYVDLLPNGDPFSSKISNGDPVTPLDTKMTVILRDKPFPVLESSVPLEYSKSTWKRLPVHRVSLQEIASDDVSKSGYERYNLYYITPRILQEQVSSHSTNIIPPIMDRESIRRHGILRMDVTSDTTPDALDYDPFSRYQRKILRDWYCLNPYFLSGTFQLGHGRPDIKIGNRLLIPEDRISATLADGNENYYIETVGNTWQAGTGMRTSIGVTRGWIGNDSSYEAALAKVAAGYIEPPLLASIEG